MGVTLLDAALGRVAERLRRSTVRVLGRAGPLGCGIVWDGHGLIVTNAHVVRRSTRVAGPDGRLRVARLVAWDPERDLAALAVEDDGTLTGAEIGDAEALRVGDVVIALGHPGGLVGAVTVGVVHATGPRASPNSQRLIQADLRLAPGNSGGPLADARGRVVGVNAMIAGGLAVAIPSSVVAAFVAGLRRRPSAVT